MTPDSLTAPFARSKVTAAWLAWLVHQTFSMLVPLDRVRRDLAGRGIAMPMSTLVGYIEREADLLDGVDGYHWKQLLAGAWMATDATADAEHRMNGVYREGVIEADAMHTGAGSSEMPKRCSPRSRSKVASSSAQSLARRRPL